MPEEQEPNSVEYFVGILKSESNATTQKLFAIEQLVAENNGVWNEDIQTQFHARVIDLSCNLDIAVATIEMLNKDVTQLREFVANLAPKQ